MASSVEQLRAERRRKLQVRESFARGLKHSRSTTADPLRFYLACADYLVTGQRRLIDQDRRLADMLEPRVPAVQRQDHQAITALRGRLALADQSLRQFELANTELRRRGTAGRREFEAAAALFLDVLVNVLGARSHSLRHLTTTLLSEEDWAGIAAITPESLALEGKQFLAVTNTAPDGFAPDTMPTEAQPRPAPGGSAPPA